MVQTDTLIIGQGLCGTWLSYWLEKAGREFIIIDEDRPMSSSRIASGVINPVTGRALAETWLAQFLLDFCTDTYTEIGGELGIECIKSVDVLHSFPTAQMRDAFNKRLPDLGQYLSPVTDNEQWAAIFDMPFGLGSIHPALLIDLNHLLKKWQQRLRGKGILYNQYFDIAALSLANGKVEYKDIKANRIIFCDGVNSLNYPYFSRLPFAPNKGEALLLRIEGLSPDHIYKKGLSLVPYPHANQRTDAAYFWAGSTYDNEYTDEQPSEAFRKRTIHQVSNWLKLPFTAEDHWAGIRPANIERRPFVGMHPQQPQVGILNGMGTKGCSLAPWMAKQLADHLVNGSMIEAEAGLGRFSRILSVV
ncbi:NAD(P)/FAD-dependent oxidoreductase [Flavihumibacter fluvii]|uniref:NAD(P)/FAD-dependent oxidoreductase n=1 Tax=Flavihumibacter fluvii TaxID=2838157 RepID=UPI001BDDF64E|nr:FAD-binding oxidoreductase [Flavihumibacter fluvii]ULQ52821.1 FAD-binding oxidoreductase [Flavihumibacter fluvii]